MRNVEPDASAQLATPYHKSKMKLASQMPRVVAFVIISVVVEKIRQTKLFERKARIHGIIK